MDTFSESVSVNNGVRQGVSLSCLLINIVLRKNIRDSNIDIRRNIFYKSIQLLTYTDDNDIVARGIPALREAFSSLEVAANRIGLALDRERHTLSRPDESRYSRETSSMIDREHRALTRQSGAEFRRKESRVTVLETYIMGYGKKKRQVLRWKKNEFQFIGVWKYCLLIVNGK
ncbi:hypothetical protein CDAR_9841 [Caerostris darwini]|uniref:Reverse transcriptase domain-containing protein n=1 Tax=Caerostris darwini TaxID=1538125 RepID=A0AAV4URL2_9ARAC|nr:hypothetical protein CDAR_9841 [Caerostris darwini]